MAGKLATGIRQSALLAALVGAGLAWGQMTPQQHQQYLNDVGQYYEQQNRQGRQSSQGPSAAEIRAWEEREAEIQARIVRHRATPYWMAVAWDPVNKGFLYPGGFVSKERAIEVVKQSCKSSQCEVLATFANSCAVIVAVNNYPQRKEDLFIGIDEDDTQAAIKARQACTAVHGDGPERCFYSEIHTGKGVEGTAFCVGYDHSIYGQE